MTIQAKEKNTSETRGLFFISLFVFVCLFTAKLIIKDVYANPVVGAIYETLWLPMLASLVVVPVVAIVFLIMHAGKQRHWALAALLTSLASLAVVIFA